MLCMVLLSALIAVAAKQKAVLGRSDRSQSIWTPSSRSSISASPRQVDTEQSPTRTVRGSGSRDEGSIHSRTYLDVPHRMDFCRLAGVALKTAKLLVAAAQFPPVCGKHMRPRGQVSLRSSQRRSIHILSEWDVFPVFPDDWNNSLTKSLSCRQTTKVQTPCKP